jgi:hypothetical protein
MTPISDDTVTAAQNCTNCTKRTSKFSISSNAKQVNTSEPSGIQANDANFANFAKDATLGKIMEEDDCPSSGANSSKDAPKDDPGLQKFKAGMKKRHCLMCGRNFSYDLAFHYLDGYICQACQSGQGPTRSSEKMSHDD